MDEFKRYELVLSPDGGFFSLPQDLQERIWKMARERMTRLTDLVPLAGYLWLQPQEVRAWEKAHRVREGVYSFELNEQTKRELGINAESS
jgi:hypothetical protein